MKCISWLSVFNLLLYITVQCHSLVRFCVGYTELCFCVSVCVWRGGGLCSHSALQQHSKLLLPQSHTEAVGKHNFCDLVQCP